MVDEADSADLAAPVAPTHRPETTPHGADRRFDVGGIRRERRGGTQVGGELLEPAPQRVELGAQAVGHPAGDARFERGEEQLDVDGGEAIDPETVEVVVACHETSVGATPATLLDRMNVIAIDGPAGAGKSTVARRLAEKLGVPYLDTGAMYRAITFAVLQRGVAPDDAGRVADVARSCTVEIGDRVLVDGVDATSQIRGAEVTRAVSAVAANPAVRDELVPRQRSWARRAGGGVMEGRDIGSAVFPDAIVKAFLTARVEVRARRRFEESQGLTLEEITADIERRDEFDSTRAQSPLRAEPDAVVIDTSDLAVDEIVDDLAIRYRNAVAGGDGPTEGCQ